VAAPTPNPGTPPPRRPPNRLFALRWGVGCRVA
jgi:hypothetical protein